MRTQKILFIDAQKTDPCAIFISLRSVGTDVAPEFIMQFPLLKEV